MLKKWFFVNCSSVIHVIVFHVLDNFNFFGFSEVAQKNESFQNFDFLKLLKKFLWEFLRKISRNIFFRLCRSSFVFLFFFFNLCENYFCNWFNSFVGKCFCISFEKQSLNFFGHFFETLWGNCIGNFIKNVFENVFGMELFKNIFGSSFRYAFGYYLGINSDTFLRIFWAIFLWFIRHFI